MMINLLTAIGAGAAAGAVAGPIGVAIGASIGAVVTAAITILGIKAIKQGNQTIEQKKNQLDELNKTTEELKNQLLENVRSEGYENSRMPIGELWDKNLNPKTETDGNTRVPIGELTDLEAREQWMTDNMSTPINPTPNEPTTPEAPKLDESIMNLGKGVQGIQDTTNENIEQSVNTGSTIEEFKKWYEEQQNKLWEREDSIRREVQAREDNAYQRAIEDMRRAGINPNLFNIQPAQSGGGITQATQADMSALTTQMNIDIEKLQQLIDNAFKEDENGKDRVTDLITSILGSVVSVILLKSL